jgi:hypothetical protein
MVCRLCSTAAAPTCIEAYHVVGAKATMQRRWPLSTLKLASLSVRGMREAGFVEIARMKDLPTCQRRVKDAQIRDDISLDIEPRIAGCPRDR